MYKRQITGIACMLVGAVLSIGVSKTYGSALPEYTHITIAGRPHNVPLKVSDLIKDGYSIAMADSVTARHNADNTVYFTHPDGGMLTTNVTTLKDESPIEESVIVDILADTGNTDTTQLAVYGNITFDSTEEEIRTFYGEPKWSFSDSNVYYISLDNESELDAVFVGVVDGKVKYIEVCNTEGYYGE